MRLFRVVVIGMLLLLLTGALILAGVALNRAARPEVSSPPLRATSALALATGLPSPAMAPTTTLPPAASVTPESGYTRPTTMPTEGTDTSAFTDTPEADSILTPFVPPVETATPLPLQGVAGVELQIVQLQRLVQADGIRLLADVLNPHDQPVRDIHLVLSDSNGNPVGAPLSIDLNLAAGEAMPGITHLVAVEDAGAGGGGNLQVHAIGTTTDRLPAVSTSFVELAKEQTALRCRFTLTNHSNAAITILHLGLALYSGDGTLLLVRTVETPEALPGGATRPFDESLPLDLPVAEGHALGEATDGLAVVSAQ